MDYKVLYRKYRPDDFSGIIGQNYITSILKNAISSSHISHAYIFSGPRGTGKTSTAKIFAKAINCLNPGLNGPCGECESCKHFKENADIIEIDAASNNGVDEIREIINNIKLAPAYSKYKVYIIDEVHMLSTSAFNALLLTLEEPPKHVVFILATTNIEAVPITILSRCQRFDFHKISIADIISRLQYVSESENIIIENDALEEIAYISDGGMRDALSILDQLSSVNSKITLIDVISHFGSVSKKQINDIYECIVSGNVNKFDDIINNFKDLAIDYKLLIRKILERIEEEAINSIKNKDYNGLSYDNLKDMAFELVKITNYININIDPYLLIKITLLKYFPKKEEIKESKSSPIISREIISPSNNEKEDKIEAEKIKNIRVNNCFVNAKKEYLNKLKSAWQEYITKLSNKSLLNMLIDSDIAAASDKVAIIINSLDSTVNVLNKELSEISSTFNKLESLNYKFIALSNSEWKQEKQKYIENIKNNKSYEYIVEDDEIIPTSTNKSNKDLEETAEIIFGENKIEIE